MREILDLIYELSSTPGLKFVGGTSLFLQNVKETITDIDVLVPNLSELSKTYEVITIGEPLYNFEGRQRAYFIKNNILVDVFIQPNNEETILIGNYATCCTIGAQIQFFEKSLKLNLTPEKRAEIISEINYLKSM